ncbi:MAG: polysaccharide biosynthesis C-terminal domain-containing protein, partial [Nitrospira sp.]|nr:polysaccharide biosynthesis C-terminal domain-containing protein [Nitrospira sp.]
MPVSAVGHYALAAGLWYQINGLFGPIGQVLYPAAAEMDVRGERESMRRLYSVGSRFMLLVVIPVVMIAYFWADDFYRLWLGEEYLTGETYSSVADLLRVLLIATLLSYMSNVAGQIVLASGHVRQLALLQISGAIINLTASLILIQAFGLIGLAVAAVMATIVVDLVGMPVLLNRLVGLHIKDFLLSAWARLLGVALLVGILFLGIRRLGQPDGWFDLILQGAFAGFAVVAVLTTIGITAEERNSLLVGPINKLRERLGSKTARNM